MTDELRIEIAKGEQIEVAAERAVRFADMFQETVIFEFNQTRITVPPGNTPEKIVKLYLDYRESHS